MDGLIQQIAGPIAMKIETALLSVSDRTGITELARQLSEMGMKILSTGGTAQVLKNEGIPVVPVSEYTDFPEILDGRVKTLHPRIHGGILARPEDPEDQKVLQANRISPNWPGGCQSLSFFENHSKRSSTT